MYILGAFLLEVWLFQKIPWVVSIFLVLVYALWYFDGKEYTGERRWEGFRKLRLWRWLSPVEYVFPNKTDMRETRGKRLFVFIPCSTPIALVWGVGLHGNQIDFNQPMHYILPPPFLWIPLVRDVLMWSGAITYSTFNPKHSLQYVLLDMLNAGRFVCYSPANFTDSLVTQESDVENGVATTTIEAQYPSEDILAFAKDEHVQIIPVITQGEYERYRIIQSPEWLRRLQLWMHQHLEYPFPLIYWTRIFNPVRPPPLLIQFGPIMQTANYESVASINRSLKEVVDKSIIHGDKLIKGL